MPLRPNLLARRLSNFELPILPFLAPRIFQPWPANNHRKFSTRATRSDASVNNRAKEGTSTGDHLVRKSEASASLHTQESSKPELAEQQQNSIQVEQSTSDSGEITAGQHAENGSSMGGHSTTRQGNLKYSLEQKNSFAGSFVEACGGDKLDCNVNPKRQETKLRLANEPRGKAKLRLAKRPAPNAASKIAQRNLRGAQLKAMSRFPIRVNLTSSGWYQRRPRVTAKATSYGFTYEQWRRRFALVSLQSLFEYMQSRPNLDSFLALKFPASLLDNLINEGTSASLRKAWEAMPEKQRLRIWPELMIRALTEHPEKVMKILVATYTEPYPMGQAVSDCLNYIIWYYLRRQPPNLSDDNPALELCKIISGLLLHGPPDHTYLSQSSVWSLLNHMPSPEHVENLYRLLDKVNNPIHVNTLTHFADQLSKAGGKFRSTAYDVLQSIGRAKDIDFNRPSMLSLCTTMLMAADVEGNFTHTELFEYMLKCGMKPNIITYNVLIYKSFKAQETERAWHIFEMMKENGIEPDHYTFSILLNDAKLRMDRPAIRWLTAAVKAKSLWSVHFVTDALHSMFLLNVREHVNEEREARLGKRKPDHGNLTFFEKMLPVYCEYFQFAPLVHLIPGLEGMYKYITGSESLPIQKPGLYEPQASVLIIMLTALLRSFEDPDTPKIFYSRFKQLVEQNDSILTEITSQPKYHNFRHIYNMVLLALGKHASNIPECLKIIADMTAKAPDSVKSDDVIESPPLRVPKPDVSTWSLLIHIFTRHGQIRAAEKVLLMMKERGIEPNIITWNSLLLGYTRMQETRLSLNVLQRMEQADCLPDNYTWDAMKVLHDRRSMVDGVKELEKRREAREWEQAEALRIQLESEDSIEKEEGPPKEAETGIIEVPEDFVVTDMAPKSVYDELDKRQTQWRRLRGFQRLDDVAAEWPIPLEVQAGKSL